MVVLVIGVSYNEHVSKSISPKEIRFAIIASDVVLFTMHEGQLLVRLIAIDRPPFFPAGSRGLPGG